jgi:hypothetical protein
MTFLTHRLGRWLPQALLLATAGLTDSEVLAQAYDHRVELQGGGGYVFGSGSDSGPSLPVFDVGIVFWFDERWGVAGRHVRGWGEDIREEPEPSGARLFISKDDLSYTTLTVRHRRGLREDLELNLGFGLLVGGRSESTLEQVRPGGPPERTGITNKFNGFSLEALIGYRLTPNVSIKAGVTEDFNFDVANTQPVVLLVLSF